MSYPERKFFCGRGTHAERPTYAAPEWSQDPGLQRAMFDGHLWEQTDTVGSEVAGFYRYDGVNRTWRLIAPAP